MHNLNGSVNYVHHDFYYYASVSNYIENVGIESRHVNPNSGPITPVFYHYFELWTSSLISKVFNITNLKAYI